MLINLEIQEPRDAKNIYIVINNVSINLLEQLIKLLIKKLKINKLNEYRGMARMLGVNLPDIDGIVDKLFGALRKSGKFFLETNELKLKVMIKQSPKKPSYTVK